MNADKTRTNEEILAEIKSLGGNRTNPTIVTPDEMNRLYPIYGSDQAIMNHKKRENDKIDAEITRLTALLLP